MLKRRSGAAVAAVLLAAGCGTQAVRVEPPEVDEATAEVCAEFVAALPDTLMDAERATVRPESELTAAWGDPPIGVRCGVPRPSALAPDSLLQEVNGVPWLPLPADDPTMYVAVGHIAYVELTVPSAHGPPAAALTALSTAVEEHIPALPEGEL
ncbi:DUF3515 domain-containing protein [Nocardiopsis sp. EMB25]|uniref:DUF3515 domain-containing protein n=1 Tax=Nocardiopsis sp. EMB25 TaxID=2835867 RepID=UPI00228391ED|nr:DUF3515 domain-containing protein [Nocardiopsis sp. EMB25]MCY9787800.1 DUF3515 domain-containing protein [Nocardiopsis sp. EMB25]